MDIKHQSLVLDINETRNYTFIKACQGDQKSRYIDCTLTQNGSVLSLTSNYRAIVKASINNEVKAINSCTIDTTSQVIVVELTSIMLDTPGILNCEITVQDGQQIVTSQAFAVQVRQSTIANETEIKKSKEYGALVDALSSIADVESKADKVQGLVDNIDKLESADRLKHLAEHGRFNFSATFTSDGVLKNTTSTEALGTGSFATSQTDIVTVFVADNVTKINSGTFGGCTSLKTIYIDNTVGNVEIVSGAIPDGVSIVYSNDDNFINVNELLASAIKSLKKQANADKSDWENRAKSIEAQHKTDVQALTDKANSIVDQANTDRQNFNNSVDEINTTLDTKENVSNKVSEITHPSLDYYPDTKAVFDYVNSKLEIPLSDIESLKAGKLDKADFNSYKTSNDNAVNSKVDTTDFNAYKSATDTDISKCVTDIANNSALISKNQINVTTDKSTSIVLNDSSDCNIVNLVLYGKSTQSAVPSPTNPVDINNINNPSITFSNDSDTQSINTQYTLRGIGNVCDTLTVNSDGTGYLVQNLQQLVLQSEDFDNLKENPSGTNTHRCTLTLSNSTQWVNSSVKYAPLCNVLQFFAFAGTEKYPCFDIRTNTLYVDLGLSLNETKATLKNCADENNGIVLVGVKQTPTVTNLTKEQINKFLNLHTYYPSTKISADTDFEVTYIANTKNYIDNKILEVATALVASESEVM